MTDTENNHKKNKIDDTAEQMMNSTFRNVVKGLAESYKEDFKNSLKDLLKTADEIYKNE